MMASFLCPPNEFFLTPIQITVLSIVTAPPAGAHLNLITSQRPSPIVVTLGARLQHMDLRLTQV